MWKDWLFLPWSNLLTSGRSLHSPHLNLYLQILPETSMLSPQITKASPTQKAVSKHR